MTEKQKRTIRFIENELKIKYEGRSDADTTNLQPVVSKPEEPEEEI